MFKYVPTWVLAVLAIGSIAFLGSGNPSTVAKTEKGAESNTCRITQEQKKQYDHFVYLLVKEKVIHKVESATIEKAYVLPKFYKLTFDEKKKFIGTVHASRIGCKKETLFLYDSSTNKQVGTFDEFWGLRIN